MLGMLVTSLLTKGLPMLANSIINMGEDKAKDFIKEKTGIDLEGEESKHEIDTKLDKVLPTLNKLDVEMRELEVKERAQELNHDLKLVELKVNDIKQARTTSVTRQESSKTPWLVKMTPIFIDLTLVTAFIGVIALLFTTDISVVNRDLVNLLIGSLIGYVSSVVAFYRGSSTTSESKIKMLDKHMSNQNPKRPKVDNDVEDLF